MARIKSPVLNSHPNPQPMNAAQSQVDQGEMETPTGIASQSTSSKHCPHCNSRLNDLSESEFTDHVDQCPSPAPVAAPVTALPGSGGSSPLLMLSRSPSPVSEILITQAALQDAEAAAVSVHEAADEDGLISDGEGDYGEGILVQVGEEDTDDNDEDADAVDEVGHQLMKDASVKSPTASPTPSAKQAAYPNISAYVTTRVEEVVHGKVVTRTTYVMDLYDASDEFPVVSQDDEVDGEEAVSTPLPLDENLDSAQVESQENVTDTEVDAQKTALDDGQVPASQLVEPEVAKDISFTMKTKTSKQFPFKKITSADQFIDYLSNPEDMSFEELYHRTSQTAHVLIALQKEYDELDYITKEADVYQKSQVREAKQAQKLLEEEKLREEEPDLMKVLERYEEQLRQREKGWKVSLDEIHKSGLKESDPETYARLMRLRNDSKLRADITEKLAKAQQASSDAPRNLVDTPLPKLTAEDYKNDKVKKRNYLESQIKFDDRKTMDVYGLQYSTAESRIGNQDLKDRNAVDENGDSIYENGRPKRSRAKRTIYDTEASGPPSPEEEEVLPAKRRRVQRNPDDADGLVVEDTSRGQTPGPRTFASGKRIGRPPKSQAKSRLNEAHIPPISGELEDEEDDQVRSADEQQPTKKQRGARAQKLDSSQENDLIESATALIEQTLSEQGVPEAPVKAKPVNPGKSKGRGGRGKKHQDVEAPADADADASDGEQQKPVAKSRVGKTKRKPAAKKLSSRYIEDDEVLISTEPDDQSRFASASTSRPTTASSRRTRSTFNSRANSRLREFAPSDEDTVEAAAPRVSTRGRGGKRKLNGGGNIQTGDADDAEIVAAPSKKRKVAAKKQLLPAEEAPQEIAEEASNPRPKRKRAATVADSIEVVRPDQVEEMFEADEAPTKKRPRAKASRSKPVKVETESDFLEDDEENPAPRKKQKQAVKKRPSSRANSVPEVPDEVGAMNLGENDDDGPDDAEPVVKKGRAPAQKTRAKKESTRKPKSKGLSADESEALLKETDPEAYEALMARKAQKSAKLSASAKARWASGLMKGPMEKRARTNAAKAAAKKSGGGSVGTTPGPSTGATADGSAQGSAPPQDFSQTPQQPPFSQGVFQAAAQPPPAQPAQTSAPINPAPTRNSKRPRKPTLKVPANFGGDGAGDDHPRSQMSNYDTFQALSSPGSPMVLGKRIRRQLVNAQQDDDDDDDDEDWGR